MQEKQTLTAYDELNFWKRVDFGGDCWLWTGAKNGPGKYGIFSVSGRKCWTHRAAYEFVKGPIPEGMLVLHRCDNPPCVNPDHLFLGTTRDNAVDAIQKKRFAFAPGANKLSSVEIAEIRRLCAAGWSQGEVARRFGVDQSNVSRIVNRKQSKDDWGDL